MPRLIDTVTLPVVRKGNTFPTKDNYEMSDAVVVIVNSKVECVTSGGALAPTDNDMGETEYCFISLDSGKELCVAGAYITVMNWLGLGDV